MSVNSMEGLDYQLEMLAAYERLQNEDSEHELLELAVISETHFLHPTKEFWKVYDLNNCAIPSFRKYTGDLNCAANKLRNQNGK